MDFSETAIRKDCPHCDPKSFALKYPLKETQDFYVVCDVHPLAEGHILIIPKKHLSCIGEYPDGIFGEFVKLYGEVSGFLTETYGSSSAFEHGKIGQTVFHSHVQMFPFSGSSLSVVPEGEAYISRIHDLRDLKETFRKDGSYLFFSIGKAMWTADVRIGKPRFFRDRFARALNNPARGNWKEMHSNPVLMEEAGREIRELVSKWKSIQAR